LLGKSTILGGTAKTPSRPAVISITAVNLGTIAELHYSVEHPDSCAPLQISIGNVPLSLFIREEALLASALRRYREFAQSCADGFPIFVNERETGMPENGEFCYWFNDAKLALGSQGAKFHGVRQEYALDSLLRVLLTMVLLPQRGFLLHGATIVRDGRAYIFFGRSGAGKSTVASMSPEGSVLTDEISLVRYANGCWQAHGTPFWGEFRAAGINNLFPIAGMYLLKQAKDDRTELLTLKQALRALLPCVLFFTTEKSAHETLLRTLVSLIEEIPCHELYFRRDPEFWKVIAA
jgi:hypothetical protein